MRAEITLTVDDSLSVVEAHAIADEARHQLIHRVPRLDDATVHVNPAAVQPGIDYHSATGHHRVEVSASGLRADRDDAEIACGPLRV